ncbi:hypothetical protein QBC35DRAFT_529502 [Podospora australis]|uniref:Uncharacterized protein n=1 Tax=Podospora australis TaxID=1536484 RepID=A0AAN6WZ52_9PEZI|nr:hypothetical protein QBC35DRAFT_529502 [Podospora australis]
MHADTRCKPQKPHEAFFSERRAIFATKGGNGEPHSIYRYVSPKRKPCCILGERTSDVRFLSSPTNFRMLPYRTPKLCFHDNFTKPPPPNNNNNKKVPIPRAPGSHVGTSPPTPAPAIPTSVFCGLKTGVYVKRCTNPPRRPHCRNPVVGQRPDPKATPITLGMCALGIVIIGCSRMVCKTGPLATSIRVLSVSTKIAVYEWTRLRGLCQLQA